MSRTEQTKSNNNPIIYDYKEAIQFIAEKCDVSKEDIKKVLYFEEKYMESIGIIDEAMEEIFEL